MELGQKQIQTLSPQMIQSMNLLQMGTMELREYLQEQIQENPALEMEDQVPPDPPHREGAERKDQVLQQMEWLYSSDVQNSWYNREDAQDLIEPASGISGADAGEESLYEHLFAQISFKDLSAAMTAAVECVLQSLDRSGRLDETPEDLAIRAGAATTVIQQAIRLVQALEPAGVAARDLSECLAIQLVRRGETGLPLTIAEKYLADVGHDHYNHIAQATGATHEEVRAACRLIRSLDPRPGISFAPRENPGYMIPDLAVVAVGDRLEVVFNDACTPALHISAYYRSLMKTTEDDELRDYLTAKVKQAKWVVQNVEQRRSTLLRCAQCIVSRQGDFFRRRDGYLHPLSLADVAEDMGIHESTVSRAIRNKYLQCARGVFPLSHFFRRSLPMPGAETAVCAERAKAALRLLIEGENRKKPLSDQKLSQLLAGQGIGISRRTVAKYRDELGIPSTTGRKSI